MKQNSFLNVLKTLYLGFNLVSISVDLFLLLESQLSYQSEVTQYSGESLQFLSLSNKQYIYMYLMRISICLYSQTSPLQPPWGQNKVAVLWRGGRYGEVVV